MAINAQGEVGRIRLFNDFFGVGDTLALTADTADLGAFYAGGEGFEDSDAGIAGKDALSGVVTITAANTDADTTFIGTHIGLDVALMGTIVLETRVQLPDLDTCEIFFGLTSILSVDEQLEDIVINASGTAITIPADCVGFYLSSELTDDEDWHGIHSGGTATASTTTTAVDLDDDAVAGEWQVLKLEIDSNGDTRWYIDGDLKKSVTGAASTSVNLALCVGVEAKGAAIETLDVDYILVKSNRDWNA